MTAAQATTRQKFKAAYSFIRSQCVDINPERYVAAGRELVALGGHEFFIWPAMMCLQARDFETESADGYIDDGM